jgi:hypothetical protein
MLDLRSRRGMLELVGAIICLVICASTSPTARAAASSLIICKKSFPGYEEPALRSFEFQSGKKCLLTSRGRTAPFAPLTGSKDYRDLSKMTHQQIEADIQRRKGGLDPANKYDLQVVQGFLLRKSFGQLGEREEKTLVRLNPKIGPVMWSGLRDGQKVHLDFSPITTVTTGEECQVMIRSIATVGWECSQLNF